MQNCTIKWILSPFYYQIVSDNEKVNSDIIKIFINNLKVLRKAKGCSCKLLSELIGCDSSYISKVENGRIMPSLDKIIAIANYFELDFIDLFRK